MGQRTYIALLGAAGICCLLSSFSLSPHVHSLNAVPKASEGRVATVDLLDTGIDVEKAIGALHAAFGLEG